jgi:hypothetical protein
MFWQQWSGIDAIIYYASNVFQSFGLTSGTIALLATGVTGVVFLISTVPAMVSSSITSESGTFQQHADTLHS